MFYYFNGNTHTITAVTTLLGKINGGPFTLTENYNNRPAPEHVVTDDIATLAKIMARNDCYVNENKLRGMLENLKEGQELNSYGDGWATREDLGLADNQGA